MQSDGGGEFCGCKFQDFFNEKGIQHKISCPRSPEQSEVTERKVENIDMLLRQVSLISTQSVASMFLM